MGFKFYNLNITEESKTSWENGSIKNPRLSLIGIEENDMTIDEAEDYVIDKIRKSFSDLKEATSINQFIDYSIIMPALQTCSSDNIDVIDFGFNVISSEGDEFDYDYSSEWKHPSEMWENFAENTNTNTNIYLEEEYNEPSDDSDSENELDIIKKSLNL